MEKNPNKILDELLNNINKETLFLTQDDILKIECKIKLLKKFINDIFQKRGLNV